MFNSKTRIGGSSDGPDFVKIDADLDTVSITITPDGTTPKAILRFSYDEATNTVHIYAHGVEDNFEQLPKGYIRGENSLAFHLNSLARVENLRCKKCGFARSQHISDKNFYLKCPNGMGGFNGI